MSTKQYKIIHNENQQRASDIYKDKNEHIDRTNEMGMVNPENGHFIVSKETGELGIGVKTFNQDKKDADKSITVSLEKTEIANRKNLLLDDLIINNQKFNMQIPQMSGIDTLFDDPLRTIGNFTMTGTVLVKVWEPHLKRYVLMRRPIRTPLFSNPLGEAEVPEGLDLDVAVIHSLGKDVAETIKMERQKESDITALQGLATGGSTYNQGSVNSYELSNNQLNSAESSLFEQLESKNEIINTNPNKNYYCWPCPGSTVIGNKVIVEDNKTLHDGWDISPPVPNQLDFKICAARAGRIVKINAVSSEPGDMADYGAYVLIDHGDLFRTLYAHLAPNSIVVKEGDTVSQGQYIGIMGKTGNAQTIHLHFSIYEYDANGKKMGFVNPDKYLNPNS